MKTSSLVLASSLAFAGVLPAAVGPDYHRPAVMAPIAWKQAAAPGALPRTEWWRLYADATLNELEARALSTNQTLRAAAARVDQARAAAGLAHSAYLPAMALVASADRSRGSRTTDNVQPVGKTGTFRGGFDLSWELDLFGRVRRLNEGARAEAVASAADFESIRLALAAEVAATYFSLRALDREIALVDEGIELRRKALELVTSRHRGGATTDFDVARAETELASTEAEVAALANRRAALQNALAVLLGEAAPQFTVGNAARDPARPPPVPAGLPAELLERRPDIVAAESALAAANARIGVAKAAFFPAISLTGSLGHASGDIDRLANSDSRVWSIGPGIYLPIFQGGRNRANLARSRAAYEESVALFRQRVLVALREVQDGLTATQLLADQQVAQDRAVAAARRAGELAQKRYAAGFVNYFEVIDAHRAVLASERAATRLGAQQLLNSIALIKALGGGWAQTPTLAAK